MDQFRIDCPNDQRVPVGEDDYTFYCTETEHLCEFDKPEECPIFVEDHISECHTTLEEIIEGNFPECEVCAKIGWVLLQGCISSLQFELDQIEYGGMQHFECNQKRGKIKCLLTRIRGRLKLTK